MTCKVCRHRFDRNLELFSEKDKVCSFCNTPWNKPGITPESKMFEECSQVLDQMLTQALDPEAWYFNAFHAEHDDAVATTAVGGDGAAAAAVSGK